MWSRHRAPPRLPRRLVAGHLPLRLRFGCHQTTLRFLRPDDAARLLAFFASHSEETVYQRYGYAGRRMTPGEAAQLVGVDQTRDAALGVFEPAAGGERLIAVGRYCLAAAGRSAEAAFVVHEERRGLGIATTLLRVLLALARERRLEAVVADVRHDNGPMIHVLRAAGATFHWRDGASSMEAVVQLGSPHPSAPPPGRAPRAAPSPASVPLTVTPP
jgi:ribosomal protein S18 acetylase RimI-like enzyme